MAKLIMTGMHEAIQLQSLHGCDVLQLDNRVTDIKARNGGFADLLIELRRGIFTFLRIHESYPFEHKVKIPTK